MCQSLLPPTLRECETDFLYKISFLFTLINDSSTFLGSGQGVHGRLHFLDSWTSWIHQPVHLPKAQLRPKKRQDPRAAESCWRRFVHVFHTINLSKYTHYYEYTHITFQEMRVSATYLHKNAERVFYFKILRTLKPKFQYF